MSCEPRATSFPLQAGLARGSPELSGAHSSQLSKKVMKAIIPVAGAGTKLRPHTYTQPKALIPLAGKTILSIIVDQLKEAGITDFIFIIGYLGDKIRDYVQ